MQPNLNAALAILRHVMARGRDRALSTIVPNPHTQYGDGWRRMVGMIAGASALTFASCMAHAQPAAGYPTRTIRLIVPTPPGISVDVTARLLAAKMAEALGQPVIVENAPGASGTLGTAKVAKSKPDGYTLLVAQSPIFTINPVLLKNATYDVDADFAPISILLQGSYLWVASNSFPPNSIPELISLAKKNPGQFGYASPGVGSAQHLGGAWLEHAAGIQLIHTPYSTNPISEVISGIVPLKMETTTVALPLIKSGKLKALATTKNSRLAILPNVPSVAEAIPGYEVSGWLGFWAPAGTPKEIIDRLSKVANGIMATPEMQKYVADQGGESVALPPGDITLRIKAERQQWATLARVQNIELKQP